ncbi:MAG: hypothetical protein ACOVQM_06130, partial [Pirellula sp.]
MKNGFARLSVALLLPTMHFGMWTSCSNVHAQQEAAPPAPGYFESPTDTEQTASPGTLPLPQHPGRLPEDPSSSLPKESQPNRAERPQKPVSARRTTSMIIPGRPSRNLPPPGFTEGGGSDALEAESGSLEAEETVGLLGFLPHQFYNGGLSFECIYTGETFTKARGGITSGRPTNYRSNLDLVGILDTERMGWWDSGRFFVYGQNLSGRPLSATEVG